VSLLPYSPIGGGVLSGKYNAPEMPKGCRFGDYHYHENPRQRAMADRFVNPATLAATEKYLEIAKDAGMAPVTLATAWSMNFDFVASTIIGARTAAQLEDSLAALDVTLTDEIMQQCDEVHKQFPYPMG
jgi:aryl-alcohol dehydrogenase-like predicted oxidoreductase